MFIACLLAVKYKTLRDWCWSWNSNTLATWCEEMTHWKRPWCWERLKVGGEGGDRGWDGWMASLTWWTCVWVSSRSWWWTGSPDVLQAMGLQRVGHDWATAPITSLTSGRKWVHQFINTIEIFVVVLREKRGKQLLSLNFRAHELQLLKPVHREPVFFNKRSHCNEKPMYHN